MGTNDVDCPFCGESVGPRDARCEHCGESLEDGPAETGGGGKVVLIVVAVVLVGGLCLVGVMATLLMPALLKAKQKANSTKCSNGLRQLGLAAIQYSDDKRFYPHVNPVTVLDGDVTTNHSPRIVRTLVYYGYHDNPEGFICPSSVDVAIPLSPPALQDLRTWGWNGLQADPAVVPLLDEGDPALDQLTELSYGFSRRGMNSNVRSTARVAADRAVLVDAGGPLANDALYGNPDTGWNVLQADASVQFFGFSPEAAGKLVSVDTSDREAGYLAIKDQSR